MTVTINLIPQAEFSRVRAAPLAQDDQLALIADMARFNTLAMVKRAGSGHLGTSFSAMDIVVWLYYQQMNTTAVGLDNPDRDIYFSSKGHDVPGLYAVLYALGVVPEEKFLKLRRFGGLTGHPDVEIHGIEANSGSLGMGISKGRGMAWAKRLTGHGGRVFVMIGDGELQEGQNYEALQATRQQGIANLTVIVDHNKVQSDKLLDEIVSLGDLEQKFAAFGWYVRRCDGHDLRALEQALAECLVVTDRPQIIIADTIKGRGVSFMEHPTALRIGQGLYPWHAGAPDDASFTAASEELLGRLQSRLVALGQPELSPRVIPPETEFSRMQDVRSLHGEPISQAAVKPSAGVSDEFVAKAFGQALVEMGARRPDLVVLDGDLAADCRIRGFEQAYPERFIENGIAEQDMVSMAGGLARQGLLPVVNSFASFLVSRANEQIYNNASEKSKIIYACHYAGLIPAGPGKSHQSIRDISLLNALPNMIILQPGNAAEAQLIAEYCVDRAAENCAIRLIIGPSPRKFTLPADYRLTLGQGVTLTPGDDAILFSYGPVMLHEALLASELLASHGFGLKVVNLPWLNRVDAEWLAQITQPYASLYTLDDHAPVGGLGDHLIGQLAFRGALGQRQLHKFAVEGWPSGGTPAQALRYHGLDGASLAGYILKAADRPTPRAA